MFCRTLISTNHSSVDHILNLIKLSSVFDYTFKPSLITHSNLIHETVKICFVSIAALQFSEGQYVIINTVKTKSLKSVTFIKLNLCIKLTITMFEFESITYNINI